jgi:hypothetical protein
VLLQVPFQGVYPEFRVNCKTRFIYRMEKNRILVFYGKLAECSNFYLLWSNSLTVFTQFVFDVRLKHHGVTHNIRNKYSIKTHCIMQRLVIDCINLDLAISTSPYLFYTTKSGGIHLTYQRTCA